MLLSGSEPAGNDSIPESSRGIVDLSPTAYLVAICRHRQPQMERAAHKLSVSY